MSANCKYYQELMSRMMDGDLLDAETAALREHIRTCPECRALCAAFSGMTIALREDEVEPPVSLVEGVMSRIRDYEAELTFAQPEPPEISEPVSLRREARSARARKKTPALRSALVAACLVLVVGVGAVATFTGRGGSADSAEAPAAYNRAAADMAESAAGIPEFGTEEAEMEAAAAAPMALAEEAPAAPEPMDPAEEAPAAEAPAPALEPYELQAAAEDSGAAVTCYTLSDPAYVPAGSEAAFDMLISEGGAIPELNYHPFFYVEHNGVIYEFLTDENEEYLLWRDAAEVFPHLSQGSFDDLWVIFK